MNINVLQGLQKLPQHPQSHVQTHVMDHDWLILIFSVKWIRVSSQQGIYIYYKMSSGLHVTVTVNLDQYTHTHIKVQLLLQICHHCFSQQIFIHWKASLLWTSPSIARRFQRAQACPAPHMKLQYNCKVVCTTVLINMDYRTAHGIWLYFNCTTQPWVCRVTEVAEHRRLCCGVQWRQCVPLPKQKRLEQSTAYIPSNSAAKQIYVLPRLALRYRSRHVLCLHIGH